MMLRARVREENRRVSVRCGCCGAGAVELVGRERVSGTAAEVRGARTILSCSACGLWFRQATPSVEALQRYYEGLGEEQWPDEDERWEFRRARKFILQSSGLVDVLDVGCWTGSFLNLLPDGIEKYGVEPNPRAAAKAREKGVRVNEESVTETLESGKRFDWITAFDVVEHTPEPREFLRLLASGLREGGHLIVTTGNREAWPWRWAALRYYYFFPTHLVFLSASWFHWLCRQDSLRVTFESRFTHGDGGLSAGAREVVAYGLWRIFKNAVRFRFVRRALARFPRVHRIARRRVSPLGKASRDHLFVVMTRVGTASRCEAGSRGYVSPGASISDESLDRGSDVQSAPGTPGEAETQGEVEAG